MPIIRKTMLLVILFFLFFSPAPAASQASQARPPARSAFSLSPLVGMLHGQAEELVFQYPGSSRYLSELLWDLKPLLYFGFAADFAPRDPFRSHGFIAETSLRFGLPRRSGVHENRDWTNPQHGQLTHFSRHDVYSLSAVLLDISAGHSWRLTDFLALRARAEFSFMHFVWSGWDGFVQYSVDAAGNFITVNVPPWHDGIPKFPLYGEVIRYRQSWFIIAPGLSLKWRIAPRFFLEGNFSYTPLIFCAARDDHLLRGRIFWDFMAFGHFINGGGRLVFSPVNNMDISLAASYRRITGTRGRTYDQHAATGRTDIFKDMAGAGFSALDISLAARIRLTGRN